MKVGERQDLISIGCLATQLALPGFPLKLPPICRRSYQCQCGPGVGLNILRHQQCVKEDVGGGGNWTVSITDPRHHILFRKIWERKQKKTKKTRMTTMFTPSLASLPLSRSLTGAYLARVTRTRRSALDIISPKITLF